MIGDADAAVFFDPAGFGSPAILTGPGVAPCHLVGIMADRHVTAGAGDFGGGVSTSIPVLTVASAAVPHWLTPDRDQVEVGGVSYFLRDVRPDGTGLSRLILERAF